MKPPFFLFRQNLMRHLFLFMTHHEGGPEKQFTFLGGLIILFLDTYWVGLTSWLLFVMSNCDVVTFPLVWCLIVSILDLCPLSYFYSLFL